MQHYCVLTRVVAVLRRAGLAIQDLRGNSGLARASMETIANNLLSVVEKDPVIAVGHAMHREPELPNNGCTRPRIREFWADPIWRLHVDLRSIRRPACSDGRVSNSMPLGVAEFVSSSAVNLCRKRIPKSIVNVPQLSGLPASNCSLAWLQAVPGAPAQNAIEELIISAKE